MFTLRDTVSSLVPARADTLAVRLGQSAAELQGQLLALELAGLLERLPGGMFQRLRA